jgi:hypothetical protein
MKERIERFFGTPERKTHSLGGRSHLQLEATFIDRHAEPPRQCSRFEAGNESLLVCYWRKPV